MIFLLSDEFDISTNRVISYLKEGFIRLNTFDYLKLNEYLTKRPLSESKDRVWFRRGLFPSLKCDSSKSFLELEVYRDYIQYYLKDKCSALGSLNKEYQHNKLIDLYKAEKRGLNIPESHIVFTYLKLKDIISQDLKKQWITKSIKDPFALSVSEERIVYGSTSIIDIDKHNPADIYLPSLVQELVHKELEIRSVFICGTFYSMGIFSQKNHKTSVDYRNYDNEFPNRLVPINLPKELEKKLHEYISQDLDLNFASIDLILDKSGKFIFLECNPCGQFDWVSRNCNYNIEEHIAKILKDGSFKRK